jgi:hypothetical protein
MATDIRRRLSEFNTVIAGQTLANGASLAPALVDLRNADSAVVYALIGRRNNTAPTAELRLSIRRTSNDAQVIPTRQFDVVNQSPTTAAAQTTTTQAQGIGDNTVTVLSATGIVVGDVVCISAPAGGTAAHQWADVIAVSGGVLTLAEPLKLAVASGDRVANLGTCIAQVIEGGDQIRLRVRNGTGQEMAVAVFVEIRTGFEVI